MMDTNLKFLVKILSFFRVIKFAHFSWIHVVFSLSESFKNGSATDGGNKVYSFQNRKHSEKMAKLGMLLFWFL